MNKKTKRRVKKSDPLVEAARFALKEYRVMVETNNLADHYLGDAMERLAAALTAQEAKDAKD